MGRRATARPTGRGTPDRFWALGALALRVGSLVAIRVERSCQGGEPTLHTRVEDCARGVIVGERLRPSSLSRDARWEGRKMALARGGDSPNRPEPSPLETRESTRSTRVNKRPGALWDTNNGLARVPSATTSQSPAATATEFDLPTQGMKRPTRGRAPTALGGGEHAAGGRESRGLNQRFRAHNNASPRSVRYASTSSITSLSRATSVASPPVATTFALPPSSSLQRRASASQRPA